MEKTKKCSQCGYIKPVFEFRKYTNAEGHRSICKECENINSKYARALKNGDASIIEQLTEMYRALESLGYRTPLTTSRRTVDKTSMQVDKILKHHGLEVEKVVKRTPMVRKRETMRLYGEDKIVDEIVVEQIVPARPEPQREDEPIIKEHKSELHVEVPEELLHWLTVDVQEWYMNDMSPEFLQETIYESLKSKYRPQIGIDKDRYIPIYDDTYKQVLNDILRRFDDYEESYNTEGEDIDENLEEGY